MHAEAKFREMEKAREESQAQVQADVNVLIDGFTKE